MKKTFKELISDQKGINTVEVVVLVAIALGLALIFREQILNFINTVLGDVLDADAYTLPPVTPAP